MAEKTACVIASDPEVAQLLHDVAADVGLSPAIDAPRADVALLQLHGGPQLGEWVQKVRQRLGPVPVVLVLSFEDERGAASARAAGVESCFTLGRPLEELREAIRGAAGLAGGGGRDER